MRGRSARSADAGPDAHIPAERRVGALAEAFRRALRASLIIANVGAVIVAFGVLVIGSQRGTTVPILLLMPIAAAGFGLVACALLPVLVRGPLRDALETFAWAGRSASNHWGALAGRRPPATAAAARAWLDAAPADTALEPLRAAAALFAGDLGQAARSADAFPTATPWDRFEREMVRAEGAWMGGGRLDLGQARRALADLPTDDETMLARALLAVIQARGRLADRRGWREPLEELRPALGGRADGILRAELWPAVFRLEVVIAAAAGVVLLVLFGLG